ncbi:hypothetical protein Esti_005532 [Eimeria stiedai]
MQGSRGRPHVYWLCLSDALDVIRFDALPADLQRGCSTEVQGDELPVKPRTIELSALTDVKLFVDRAGRQGILLVLKDEQTPWRLWCRDGPDLELWIKGLSLFLDRSSAHEADKSSCQSSTEPAPPQIELTCAVPLKIVIDPDLPVGSMKENQLRGARRDLARDIELTANTDAEQAALPSTLLENAPE